jgi:PII-like signaling protein
MIRAQLMRLSFSLPILTQLPDARIDLSQVLRQVSTSTVKGMLV